MWLSVSAISAQPQSFCPLAALTAKKRAAVQFVPRRDSSEKGNDLWKLSPEIFRERCASCPFFFSLFGCYRNTKIHQPFLFRMRFAVVQVDLERQAAALATMLVY